MAACIIWTQVVHLCSVTSSSFPFIFCQNGFCFSLILWLTTPPSLATYMFLLFWLPQYQVLLQELQASQQHKIYQVRIGSCRDPPALKPQILERYYFIIICKCVQMFADPKITAFLTWNSWNHNWFNFTIWWTNCI